jgi:hypothetical protein
MDSTSQRPPRNDSRDYLALLRSPPASFADPYHLLLLLLFGEGEKAQAFFPAAKETKESLPAAKNTWEWVTVVSVNHTDATVRVKRGNGGEGDISSSRIRFPPAVTVPPTPDSPQFKYARGYEFLPPEAEYASSETSAEVSLSTTPFSPDLLSTALESNEEDKLLSPASDSTLNKLSPASDSTLNKLSPASDFSSNRQKQDSAASEPPSKRQKRESPISPQKQPSPYTIHLRNASCVGEPFRSEWELILLAVYGEGSCVELELQNGRWLRVSVSKVCVQSRCLWVKYRTGHEAIVRAESVRRAARCETADTLQAASADSMLPWLLRMKRTVSPKPGLLYTLSAQVYRADNGLALQCGTVTQEIDGVKTETRALFLVESSSSNQFSFPLISRLDTPKDYQMFIRKKIVKTSRCKAISCVQSDAGDVYLNHMYRGVRPGRPLPLALTDLMQQEGSLGRYWPSALRYCDPCEL